MHYSNSQEDQAASPSARPDSGAHSAKDEGDDPFWGLDDMPGRLFMSLYFSIMIVYVSDKLNAFDHFMLQWKQRICWTVQPVEMSHPVIL